MIKELNNLENIKLVRRLAWSFNFTTGIEFSELQSEALLAYTEAMNTYDPEKCKISTHLYNRIHNALIDYCKRQNKMTLCEEFAGNIQPVTYQKHKFEIDDMFEGIARDVVDIIFSNLDSFDFNVAPKLCRGQITKFFMKRGWSRMAIFQTMKEVRFQVQNN